MVFFGAPASDSPVILPSSIPATTSERPVLNVTSSLTTCHNLNFSLWHNWVRLSMIFTAAIAAPICNLGWWSSCIFRSNTSQQAVMGPVSTERHPEDWGAAWCSYRRRWWWRRYGLYMYFGKWSAGQSGTEWRVKAAVLMLFHQFRQIWH